MERKHTSTEGLLRENAEPDADHRPQLPCSQNQNLVSYSYHAYGLGIDSSNRIGGLKSAGAPCGKSDLSFEAGPQPGWVTTLLSLPSRILSHKTELAGSADPSFVLTQHGEEDGFDLAYSDGTRFVVDRAARRVWGTYQDPLTEEDMATYFLGPVMGFVLRRRHIACLHASGVEFFGQGVAFCGDAGYGKSTTAAALALRGFPVLAEDILVLKEVERQFHAVPGYPRICLWPESVRMLLGAEDALPKLTPVWDKRYLDLDGERVKFANGSLPLGMIYLFAPRSSDTTAPRVEKLSPREALLELVQNTYMNWVLGREQRATEFDTLCRLVTQVTVRRIVPHNQPDKIAALCELIQLDAESHLTNSRHSAQPVQP